MTTTATPTLGTRQQDVLGALITAPATAPEIRDAVGLSGDTYGTRQTHAVLRRLTEQGYVASKAIAKKHQKDRRVGTTGRPPTTEFKITAAGKKALKAA